MLRMCHPKILAQGSYSVKGTACSAKRFVLATLTLWFCRRPGLTFAPDVCVRPRCSQRVHAALPQIQSLNPLVKVTPIPTASPFIPAAGETPSTEDAMDAFIKREEIDIVCVTDASKDDMVSGSLRLIQIEGSEH